MSVSPMGMGGGLDINSMVSKIVESERLPKQQRIDRERSDIDTNISGYGRLQESLDTMKNLMTTFRQDDTFASRTISSSDEDVVSATASPDALAGRYTIDVLQLAQAQKLASSPIRDDAKFGPGKLEISLGKKSFTIDVVGQNNKITDILKQINSAPSNPGVQASIVKDDGGSRLILASDKPGESNKVKIEVDAKYNNQLHRFAFNPDFDPTVSTKFDIPTLLQYQQVPEVAAQQVREPITEQEVPELSDEEKYAYFKPLIDYANRELAREEKAAKEIMMQQEATAALATLEDPTDPTSGMSGWSERTAGTLQAALPNEDEKIELAKAAKQGDQDAAEALAEIGQTPDTVFQAAGITYEAPQQEAPKKEIVDIAKEKVEKLPPTIKEIAKEKLEPIEKVVETIKPEGPRKPLYSGLQEVQSASSAKVVLDGVARISSDTNVIQDAVQGVDITLKGTTAEASKRIDLDVQFDRDTVKAAIEQFVNTYNQFYETTKALSGFDPATGQSGPLAGDSVVRSAESRLKSVFVAPVESAPKDVKTLIELGISTTRQGTLEINHTMLDRQLNENFGQLHTFFGGSKGFAKKIEDVIQSMTGVTGPIRTRMNTMRDQNYRLNDQQVDLDRRMESLQERTRNKFANMQDVTGKMKAQLSGMMNALG
ncbi:flagellar filament capping protein FliD [Aliivibrio fischeri]|uniref:flagellar filament capping protein FliD n=1 Tax=Aliivibrio fischeri TaxID=668 RepID=UPI00080E55C9|nr:flagellar filament capping protein FliD [Aliivibrio fischeri]OCH38130.1 flagellar cap protein FliD [Aliivibrio fischeri]